MNSELKEENNTITIRFECPNDSVTATIKELEVIENGILYNIKLDYSNPSDVSYHICHETKDGGIHAYFCRLSGYSMLKDQIEQICTAECSPSTKKIITALGLCRE